MGIDGGVGDNVANSVSVDVVAVVGGVVVVVAVVHVALSSLLR